MTGYKLGHDVIGPALSRIKAMDDENYDEEYDSDGNPTGRMLSRQAIISRMNNDLQARFIYQSRMIASGEMPGLDDKLGMSFQGGPPGFILKRISTKYTLPTTSNSTSGLIVYNVDKMGRLVLAQFDGSSNNAIQLNTYSGLTEARRPQHGDYFIAANLVVSDNSDGNTDTGVFTAGVRGIRSKVTNGSSSLYDLTSPAVDVAQTKGAITKPFRGTSAVAVCTSNCFMFEREDAASFARNTGISGDPTVRTGLCVSYEGIHSPNDASRIIVTLHEYVLSPPSPDVHPVNDHASAANHLNELMELTFQAVNAV